MLPPLVGHSRARFPPPLTPPPPTPRATIPPLPPPGSLTVVRIPLLCVQGILLHMSKRARRTSGEKEAQTLKVASGTDSKVLGGAISAFAREGRRTTLIAIGAGSINAAVKGLAIARKNVEDEAIDLLCKPEFTEARVKPAFRIHIESGCSRNSPRAGGQACLYHKKELGCKLEFTEATAKPACTMKRNWGRHKLRQAASLLAWAG